MWAAFIEGLCAKEPSDTHGDTTAHVTYRTPEWRRRCCDSRHDCGRRSAAAQPTKLAPVRGSGTRAPTSHAPQRCEDSFGVLVDQLNPAIPEALDQTLSSPGPDVLDREQQRRGAGRHRSDV